MKHSVIQVPLCMTFSYEAFCDVLEMIQPENTGLKLFSDKRPLQYAKPTLQPGDSWPMRTNNDRNGYGNAYERPRDAAPPQNWQRDSYRADDRYGGDGYDSQRRGSPYRGQGQQSYREDEVSRQ